LEITSGHTACQCCHGALRSIRTVQRHPIGLMLGRPRVRLKYQKCKRCGRVDPLDAYYQNIPPKGNYAYDVIVEVGLARFRDRRQDEEIQRLLEERWRLTVPADTIGQLADSCLDGLAAVHQAHVSTLRQKLSEEGGYIMHVDGTCEADTDVLFTAIAEPHGWMLETAKMTSENQTEIIKMLSSCVQRFGVPQAVVRDLSPNIAAAVAEVIPEARDLICQYHFLENVGKALCEKPHGRLTAALRRLKICPPLKSIRTDLVRWSRKGKQLSTHQIKHLLSHPKEISGLDSVVLRRFVAYVVLRWLDDYKVDLKGEYFPFDLPQLAFYRRGLQLEEMLSKVVTSPKFPQRELTTLKTIARHLRSLRDNQEVVAAAAHLEMLSGVFEELRDVLRLSSCPGQRWNRGRCPSETAQIANRMVKRLHVWRDRLQRRHDRERDEQKQAAFAIVLNYLKKYSKQLVGHVIDLGEGRKPLVACRTNNPAEHRFGSEKQGIRRKVGVKKLTRQIQALRPEAFLVWNLESKEYLNIVLHGSLENLPSAMANHWDLACEIRSARRRSKSNHPMPTTKQQLRTPTLLNDIGQMIDVIVNDVAKQNDAA
jgi:hypothetical protein